MGIATVTIVYVAAAVLTGVHAFGPRAGPYDILIEKSELCDDQGSGKFVFRPRITNAGRGKYFYNENFTLGVPVDENFKVNTELQNWGNGGWKHRYAQLTANSCEGIWKYTSKLIKSVMKSAGVTIEKCPVPAGNYTADNWLIDVNVENNFPVMEYGKYRGIVKLFYKKERAGCYKIYGEVVPKAL